MQKGRVEQSTKKRLLLNAGDLLSALGLEITTERQESIDNAKAVDERKKKREKAYNKAHRAERTAKHMEYYYKNHEKILEQRKAWGKANRKKLVAKNREYVKRNAEKVKAYMKNYRKKNREHIRELQRISYEKHREEYNARARERYAAKKAQQNSELDGGQGSKSTTGAKFLSELAAVRNE